MNIWAGSALLALLSTAALADGGATVYRTVNEQGVVSFSDSPPADADSAERVNIDYTPAPDDTQAQQRLQEMRETTDRMAADRREREKHRAEMRQLAAQQQAQSEPVYSQRDDDGWYYSDYGGYYYPYRPHRPHIRPPHPRPPLARPPLDTEAWSRRHNSQLMRPILPRGR